MSLFRVYIAVSLDHCIASADGGVDWLEPFQGEDFGYTAFIGKIDTIVMGRLTYEQVRGFGDWPYPGTRTLVLSSQPLTDTVDGVERFDGDLSELVTGLRDADLAGDVWVHGGAQTINAFLALGAVDRIELFVIPVTVGDGIKLFDQPGDLSALSLIDEAPGPLGVVKQTYEAVS